MVNNMILSSQSPHRYMRLCDLQNGFIDVYGPRITEAGSRGYSEIVENLSERFSLAMFFLVVVIACWFFFMIVTGRWDENEM